MKNCFYCEFENRMQARFCGNCGKTLNDFIHCIQCNILLPKLYHYCDSCGLSLVNIEKTDPDKETIISEPTHLTHANDNKNILKTNNFKDELRYVTVLFADISGFTKWSENRTPEEIKVFMNDLFIVLSKNIEEAGGTVDKYIGDCVMAVFGAPKSHGDDPIRAVKAALNMQKSLSAFNKERSILQCESLQIRIGINSGLALAGAVGAEKTKSYTVMGDTVNIASRIESIAKPGEIYISEETKKFISDQFESLAIGEVMVKGKSEPVSIHKILGYNKLLNNTAKSEIQERHQCIGRTREIDQIRYLLKEAELKMSSMIIDVRGKRGVGKTYCIDELLIQISSTSKVIRADNSLFEMFDPYRYFSILIQKYLHEDDKDRDRLIKIIFHENERLLAISSNNILDSIINGKMDETHYDFETLKLFLFSTLSKLMKYFYQECRKNIVLVVGHIEQLNDVMKEFIEYINNNQKEDRFPLVIIHESHSREASSLSSLNNYHEILIPAFTNTETEQLVKSHLQNNHVIPSELYYHIHRLSDGIPLLAIEQLKVIIQKKCLHDTRYIQTLKENSSEYIHSILPSTIYQLFQSEFDDLNDLEKEILRHAAVIGDVFWDKILFCTIEHIPCEIISSALNKLCLLDYIKEKRMYGISNFKEYHFANHFLRKVIYNTIPSADQKKLHFKTAQKIESSAFAKEFLTLIHSQYEKAKDKQAAWNTASRLIEYYLHKMLLNEALYIVEKYCTLDEEDKNTNQIYREAALYKTEILYHKGDYQSVLNVCNMFLNVSSIAKTNAVSFKIQLAKSLHKLGRHNDAINTITSFIDSCDTSDLKRSTLLELNSILAWNYLETKQTKKALKICKQFIQDTDNTIDKESDPHTENAFASLYDTLGGIYRRKNNLDLASQYYHNAKSLRLKSGNVRLLCVSDNNLALIETMKKNYQNAIALFHDLYNKRKFIGAPFGIGVSAANLAETLLLSGQKEKSLPYIKKCLEIGTAIKSPILTEAANNLLTLQ